MKKKDDGTWRYMVTGVTGLLGANLALTAAEHGEVVGISRSKPSVDISGGRWWQVDITDPRQVHEAVRQTSPQIVFHCAAETRVDYCEDNPQDAMMVNVIGTRVVARAAASAGAMFVYISTDSVFDGVQGGYSEVDEPRPVNVYARSKYWGEQAVREEVPQHVIVRTNFYGWNILPKESLSEWILNHLRTGEVIHGFGDVIFAPLLVNDLGDILLEMVARRLRGLFHVTAHDVCSKFEFARIIASQFGMSLHLIREASVDDKNFRARRPKVTWLNVAKVESALGRQMPTVREGVGRFRALWEKGYVDRLRSSVPSGGKRQYQVT